MLTSCCKFIARVRNWIVRVHAILLTSLFRSVWTREGEREYNSKFTKLYDPISEYDDGRCGRKDQGRMEGVERDTPECGGEEGEESARSEVRRGEVKRHRCRNWYSSGRKGGGGVPFCGYPM